MDRGAIKGRMGGDGQSRPAQAFVSPRPGGEPAAQRRTRDMVMAVRAIDTSEL